MTNSAAEEWVNSVESMPAPKYSSHEVLLAIETLTEGDVNDFWYDPNNETLEINGFQEKVTEVENYGGEGMGETRYVVFKIGEQFFRKDGYYVSYDGTTWDGDFYECFPVVRSVTFYERGVKPKKGSK